ncbi:MAG TPA: hypothetical protein VEB86_05505 [Chryseosolibacter sp.]|nr:hypothetical protein [Chryseosolibacter sp.]
MKKYLVFALIGVVILVIGVYKNFIGYIRYGKSFNDTRRELGVPIIEENFRPNDDYLMWYNEQRVYPRHAVKLLSTNWLSIDIEQDNFEFIKDSTVVTAYCYYHHEEKCYNIYLSEGGSERKISCKTLLKLLDDQGLSVKINCKDC